MGFLVHTFRSQVTIHKSTKQFGFSFAFDAPTVWNSLPEDIHASPTIASFRKKLKTYLYTKAYPLWLIFSYGFTVVPTCFCPWTLNLHYAFVLLRLRVRYSVEIKRYKSQIRITVNFVPLEIYFLLSSVLPHIYWLLHHHTAKTEMSDELLSPNMYEYFMNTKYLWKCLQQISYKFDP